MFVTSQKIYPVFSYLKLFRTSPGCFDGYQKLHQRYAYIPVCRETRCMQSDFSRYRNMNFVSLKNHKPYICSFMSMQRFHNSSQCHSLPYLECLLLIQVVKLTVIISGRKWNKWLNNQTDSLRSHYRRRLGLVCLIGIPLAVFTCVTLYRSNLEDTPVTGRKRYITNKSEQMVGPLEMLSEYILNYEKHLAPAGNSNYRKVNAIIRRIVESNKDLFPDLMPENITVKVISGSPLSVGITHDGDLLITKEFLSACSKVDEVAAVVGHELAHYGLSHPAEIFSSFKLVNFIYIIGLMVPIWFCIARLKYAVLAQSVCTVLKFLFVYLPTMRQQEKEADIVGLQMMAKACYDARAATVIFSKFAEFDKKIEKFPKRTPDNELFFEILECFATHPEVSLRIEYMERLIPELPKQTPDNELDFKIMDCFATRPAFPLRIEYMERLIPEVLKLRKECNCPPLKKSDPRRAFYASKRKKAELKKKIPTSY